jgi:predicted esterase
MPRIVAAAFAPVLLTAPLTAQDPQLTTIRTWFATAPDARGPAPGADIALDAAAIMKWLPDLVAACRDGERALGRETLPPVEPDNQKAMQPKELKVGEFTFPYVLLVKGKKPATGWPLYLCLHGGGGNAEANGPHGWAVNDREWQAQRTLCQRIYPNPGLYFIPRMADDRQGRWWFDHDQIAFDDVIRQAIQFREVDPDRVYLMGISEGGYGAIRFAGNRPDRFAACGAMAAAEPLDTSPPENMRNVALRIDIGEQDTMFDRIGLARRMGERLAELQASDAGGYDFVVHVQEGRGHGIDYRPCPQWLATKVRNARPDRIVWTVQPFHTRVALQNGWLALDAAPTTMPLHLVATLRSQTLDLVAEVADPKTPGARVPALAGTVRVRVDAALCDLGRPIAIRVNGKERPAQPPRARLATMVQTLAERGDPRLCFPAELVVDLGG